MMADYLVAALLVVFISSEYVMESGGDNATLSPASSSTGLRSTSEKPTSLERGIPTETLHTISPGSSAFPLTASSSSSSSSTGPSSSVSYAVPVLLPLAPEFGTPALIAAHVHEGTNPVNFRHRHYPNYPRGPHFEENVVNVTVREFQHVHLDCHVALIEDKLVSWVRRRTDQLELLTLGTTNHSSDPRFSSDFRYPNNWRLGIRNASRNDSGVYLCQISTHPPKVLEVQLTVEAPEVFVISSRGERIQDVYYKEGSTLQLICEVNSMKSRFVNWYHNADLLNHDITRGGVSIKTEIVGDSAKSILNLARISRKDMGTYRCFAPPQNATVTVHILNGENPAELYRNGGVTCLQFWLSPASPSHLSLFPAVFYAVVSSFYFSFWWSIGLLWGSTRF